MKLKIPNKNNIYILKLIKGKRNRYLILESDNWIKFSINSLDLNYKYWITPGWFFKHLKELL